MTNIYLNKEMSKLYKFLFGLIVFQTQIYALNLDDNRVEEFDNQEDFQAVVYVKVGNSICSGALINHRTILTAAHCLIEGTKAEIYLGNIISDDSQPLHTSSFVKHPEDPRYVGFNGASYDLALISLNEPFTSIKPLNLSLDLPSLNKKVYLSGYGLHGTGSSPDEGFDKKRRWGTNTLTIIAKEDSVLGPSTSDSNDQIILGFYFDENVDPLESLISLGDSGSPLLVKENNIVSIVGIASWISKNPITLNRGYGAKAGYASISENMEWLNQNNPLRLIDTTGNGDWEHSVNWTNLYFPNNFVPDEDNYNNESSRYYSVNIQHQITLNDIVIIDFLKITENGQLLLKTSSRLETELDSEIQQGSMENHGVFYSDNLYINDGIVNNYGKKNIEGLIVLNDGILRNDGEIFSEEVHIINGLTKGTGIFHTDNFVNNGTLNPGNTDLSIGKLSFSNLLTNTDSGIIQIDIENQQSLDSIVAQQLSLDGHLHINPLSDRYSGNSNFKLIEFKNFIEGNFKKIDVINSNFGRLLFSISYDDSSVRLDLYNPLYEDIGINNLEKNIGQHIDSFSKNASGNFQALLNEINYTNSNFDASSYLKSLYSKNTYSFSIESLENLKEQKIDGIFISEERIDIKEVETVFDSKVKRFDISKFGFNLAYLANESYLTNSINKEITDSNAYFLGYAHKSNLIDLSFNYYSEESEMIGFRDIQLNKRIFKAKQNKDFNVIKKQINLSKDIQTNGFTITPGFSYADLELKTDPFFEEINGVSNNYIYDNISGSKVTSSLDVSKSLIVKNFPTQVSFGFSKSNYNIDDYNVSVLFDNALESMPLSESLEMREDTRSSFEISTELPNNLHGKVNYSRKKDSSWLSLQIGLRF